MLEPQDGETFAAYVERGIEQLFQDVATVYSTAPVGMTEDETAGVPMAIFGAQLAMITAWRAYMGEMQSPTAGGREE